MFETMKNTLYLLLLISIVGCGETKTIVEEAYENPVDSISAIIKGDQGNSDLYFERSKAYFQLGDVPASLSDVGRALSLDSSKADYYIFLASLKIINKQSRESRDALLKAYEINPDNVDVLVKLGELYMLVDDYANSFKYLNEALRVDVNNATAYRLKGFNYKYAGDTVKAVSSFRTAIEQDPEDYDSYLQLGLLFSIPLEPIALDYYNNALRVKPNSLEVMYAKAFHLQRAGEVRSAIRLYDEIIELNPNYFNAHYNKGYIYLEYLAKYDSASMAFTESINYGPEKYFQALYNRGLAKERADFTTEALEDYKMVLEMNPQYDLAAMAISRISE